MAVDKADFAQECVRQGYGLGIEPHYLLGVAQHRSGIADDTQDGKVGPFRLTQAEWDANRDNDEFDIHLDSEDISDPNAQCIVFALMTRRAFDAFVQAKSRNPSALELYLQQFPNEASPTLATELQQAFDATASLLGPAADALLDEPGSVGPIPDVKDSKQGPGLNLGPDPVPPAGGGGPGMLTLAMLERHWGPATPALRQGMASNAGVLTQLGINTPLRMAHFMAQITAETDGGTFMAESLNYSAERMMQVFPKRFPTSASTQGFAHNEQAFGNKVYNGRMGNRVGSDDGFNFRGRGCLQLTGRDNYTAMAKACNLDLVNNPDQVNNAANVLLIAGTEFVKLGCLAEADRDDVVQVSARVNLGHTTSNPASINGLAKRQQWLTKWKQEFGV